MKKLIAVVAGKEAWLLRKPNFKMCVRDEMCRAIRRIEKYCEVKK